MSPRSRRTCHAPTWYGKIMPAAENPTPSTALALSSVDDDVAALGGARVTRTARRSTTPRVRGTRLCARDETAFGAVGAGETLMFWKRAPHRGAVCAAKWRERRWPLVLPRTTEGLSPHDQGTRRVTSHGSDGAAAHGNRNAGDVRRRHRTLVQGCDDSEGTHEPRTRDAPSRLAPSSFLRSRPADRSPPRETPPQAGGGVATKAAMAAAGTGAAYTGYKTVAAPTQDK